ncbi:hypothetical protein SMKI_07G1130 [Saccharomyces mikatae IFO 1815]|uniref:HECT-type E3 ubiquitin transferase n=1 Tax=Saccharomyces mikatae IFO 1815 TaxID=226126 RepID=A0AA35J0Y0_SACMI|nr:uncharacterized protein SMKI_07G1130 [Saccharomyces mikatae IFO 1815]CAI4039142.1 hypothetical protein SMKI_07G1130 [Saccharomyces mikatae IFO 1815]
MLNFTGQTRRRNVNLGNRTRNTKKDLLEKAKKERERRAQDKLKTDASKTIQKSIRKHFANVELFKSTFTSSQLIHMIPAYGGKLIYYISSNDLQQLLSISHDFLSTYPNSLGNRQLLNLLKLYQDDTLVMETLSDLNMNYPIVEEFLDSLSIYMRLTSSLSYSVASKIADAIEAWGVMGSDASVSIFSIPIGPNEKRPFALQFYCLLAERNLLPRHVNRDLILWENMAKTYSHCSKTGQRNIAKLLIPNFNNHISPLILPSDNNYVLEFYEKAFIDEVISATTNHVSNDDYVTNLMWYIASSPNQSCKNSVLITLLSNKDFVRQLSWQFFHTEFNASKTEAHPLFSVLAQLIDMHLLISTDRELLDHNSVIPIEELKRFTSTLKDFTFRQYWELPKTDRNPMLKEAVPLLNKIYERDSRLHFLSTEDNLTYWENSEKQFLNLRFYEELQEYEDSYRENLEHANDEDDGKELDLDKEKNLLKSLLLNKMKKKIKSSLRFRKLEILLELPFFIPFEERVDLFYMFIALDKKRLSLDDHHNLMNMFAPWASTGMKKQSAIISRDNVLEDAFNAFNSIGERFKAPLDVTFINEFGEEAGIDGGGITKEFLTNVSDEGFKDPKHELFQTNDRYELYPSVVYDSKKLKFIWFLGKVVGKCLYEHVLIDVSFADFFLKKLLNCSNGFLSSFPDLGSYDSVLYSNLIKLLNMTVDEIRSLDLTFEIDEPESPAKVIDLIPNGSKTYVTKDNVLLYITKVTDYKLNKRCFKPVSAFHGGLSAIIAPHWMEMFNSIELQMLISGERDNIDLDDLKCNTEYGGYTEDDQTVVDFWEVLNEFKYEDKLNFLKFVTSVPQAPLQGFKALDPKFGVRNAGTEKYRLPTASTCVNLLKLPDYRNKRILREKLLYAINSGARFDLS